MSRKRKKELEVLIVDTKSITMAFDAAMKLYAEWESPEGPAVVTDVDIMVGGGWAIHCRLISVWGKEAWL